MQRPLRSQSPKRVGSGPAGPPISPVIGLTPKVNTFSTDSQENEKSFTEEDEWL